MRQDVLVNNAKKRAGHPVGVPVAPSSSGGAADQREGAGAMHVSDALRAQAAGASGGAGDAPPPSPTQEHADAAPDNAYLASYRSGELASVRQLNLFRSDRRVTEAASMLRWARELFARDLLGFDERDAVVVVGDGREPLTATVFRSAYPRARVLSVDPDADLASANPLGVEVVRQRIQDADLGRVRRAVVVMLHAHVGATETCDAVARHSAGEPGGARTAVLGLVACPCCDFYAAQSDVRGAPPTLENEDALVLSRERVVRAWRLAADA